MLLLSIRDSPDAYINNLFYHSKPPFTSKRAKKRDI